MHRIRRWSRRRHNGLPNRQSHEGLRALAHQGQFPAALFGLGFHLTGDEVDVVAAPLHAAAVHIGRVNHAPTSDIGSDAEAGEDVLELRAWARVRGF